MSSQNVKVGLRIRPLTANELLSEAKECVSTLPGQPVVVVGSNLLAPVNAQQQKTFTFDYVFGTESTHQNVYNECVVPLIDRFQEGYNATIVAYGQTGSGKTFSMGTGLEVDLSDENQGVVPRVIRSIFHHIQQKAVLNPMGYKYSVAVSFLELYNEDLVDLLNPVPKASDASWGGLSIREDSQGNIIWSGVREEDVDGPDALMRCLQKGSLCRATGSTDMNASSSRSHAIFSIILKQEAWTPSEYFESVISTDNKAIFDHVNTPDGSWSTFSSKFHFVDLAGSERLKRTNALGDRKKEGISINQGLLSLGNVISALGDDNRKVGYIADDFKSTYVPFRDSKLTRLLQDSLGGNSQTLMLACISPSTSNYGETLSTLQYANRARNIKNKVTVNQILAASSQKQEKEVLQLRLMILKLKDEIQSLRGLPDTNAPISNPPVSYAQKAENNSLWLERQIQQQLSSQQSLQIEMEHLKKLLKSRDFEVEKLTFFQSRLYERSRDLNKELTSVLAQRDVALIDSAKQSNIQSRRLSIASDSMDEIVDNVAEMHNSHQLEDAESSVIEHSLSSIPATNPVIVPSTSPLKHYDNISMSFGMEIPRAFEDVKVLGQPTNTIADVKHYERGVIILGYINAISQLRFRLADTDDKLRWYKNVFETLGSTKNNPTSHHELLHDFMLTYPVHKKFHDIAEEEELDVDAKHEKRLFRALNDNPELRQILREPREGDTRDANLHSHLASSIESHAEPTSDFGANTTLVNEESLPASGHMRTSSLYLLVDKIQSDISENEKIVSKLQRRDAEYEAMKNIFQQKLSGLKDQLTQVQRERDLAIQRMRSDTQQPKEKAGTIAIKARFDKKHKQLEAEISDLRNKLVMRTNSKVQSLTLTKNLLSTIQSLKAEKLSMTRKLKQEADKSRELAVIKERELEKFRLRERKSDEILRKLERNGQFRRQLVGNRSSDDRSSTQQRIKNVLSIIRRTPSASRISRIPVNSIKQPLYSNDDATALILSSPIGSTSSDHPLANDIPPLNIRAQFKKQMLETELESCIRRKRIEFKLHELSESKIRLLGEQRELLSERERCIELSEENDARDPEIPYYMDERLEIIDCELAMIESRIDEFKSEFSISGTEKDRVAEEQGAFENAENILKSLDSEELHRISLSYMQEVIDLRVAALEKDMRLAERDKMVLELRAVLETLRAAALKTSMQFEKKIVSVQNDAKKLIQRALHPALQDSFESSIPQSSDVRISPSNTRASSLIATSPFPLPQIMPSVDREMWNQHGNDPALVAQAVLSNAMSNNAMRSLPTLFISPPRKTLEEMNVTLGQLRYQRSMDESKLPPRPQSAPLFSMKLPEKTLVSLDESPRRYTPTRTPSPEKVRFKIARAQYSPVQRSSSLSAAAALEQRQYEELHSSKRPDDSQIWQEALNAIQLNNTTDDMLNSSSNVFERLASKHTVSTFQKKKLLRSTVDESIE